MKSRTAPIAGISACFTLYSSMLASAYSFVGKRDEPFSILNCFISDLGDYSLSPNHFVFNFGVMLAGLGFGIFAYGCRGLIPTKLARFSVVTGIIASALLVGVGLVPSHHGWPHLVIALGFFSLMTLALSLYSYCIWKAPSKPLPKYTAMYGFCSPIAFIIFISMPKDLLNLEDAPGVLFEKPDFWGLAFSEWAVFFFLTTWVILVSAHLLRLPAKPAVELRKNKNHA